MFLLDYFKFHLRCINSNHPPFDKIILSGYEVKLKNFTIPIELNLIYFYFFI